jgi:shikimate kinase
VNAIYLVGPSAAGKSTLSRMLAKDDPRFAHVSLDKELNRLAPGFRIQKVEDWNIRWKYCQQILHELELPRHRSSTQIYLIDTGAGALQTEDGRAYFIERASRMICLNGEPKVIYERNKARFIARQLQPRLELQFYDDEYSSERQEVYNAAHFTIDTTATDEKDALAKLKMTIESILAN